RFRRRRRRDRLLLLGWRRRREVRFAEDGLGAILQRVDRFLQLLLAQVLLDGGLHALVRRGVVLLDLDDVVAVLRLDHRRELAGLGLERGLLDPRNHLAVSDRPGAAAARARTGVVRFFLGQLGEIGAAGDLLADVFGLGLGLVVGQLLLPRLRGRAALEGD